MDDPLCDKIKLGSNVNNAVTIGNRAGMFFHNNWNFKPEKLNLCVFMTKNCRGRLAQRENLRISSKFSKRPELNPSFLRKDFFPHKVWLWCIQKSCWIKKTTNPIFQKKVETDIYLPLWLKGLLNNPSKLVLSDDEDNVRDIVHMLLHTCKTHKKTTHASFAIPQLESRDIESPTMMWTITAKSGRVSWRNERRK